LRQPSPGALGVEAPGGTIGDHNFGRAPGKIHHEDTKNTKPDWTARRAKRIDPAS
jgi:hypothetical protein